MWKQTESYFYGKKRTKLFFQNWIPEKNHHTHILITHGQGEHSDCYHRLITQFAGTGVGFTAWDLQGHGRSEGRRGYAENFQDYVDDFFIFEDGLWDRLKLKDQKKIYFSHSMGALLSVAAINQKSSVTPEVLILSSPLLGLTVPIPLWKREGSHYLNRLVPRITVGNEIEYEMLTQDGAVIEEYERDTLRHSRISPGVFLGFLENMEAYKNSGNEIKCPTAMLVPEVDPVVNSEVSREFFQQMPNSKNQLFVYPESRHELINDIHRTTVFADIKQFLKNQGIQL